MEERATYTIAELAAELNIGKGLVYAQLRSGAIPHIKLASRYILPKALIAQWLATGEWPQVPQVAPKWKRQEHRA